MADIATMKPSYAQTFVVLLVVNTVTVAAVYALMSNHDGIRNLAAVTLLAVVVVAQTLRCRPFLPILSWVSTIPVAIAMAYLIGANPNLDWSGPCAADEICFAPILPVVVVSYRLHTDRGRHPLGLLGLPQPQPERESLRQQTPNAPGQILPDFSQPRSTIPMSNAPTAMR